MNLILGSLLGEATFFVSQLYVHVFSANRKVKTLGNDYDDDDDPAAESAAAWVAKMRKSEEEKKMADKRVKY